jgi:hypothetical protein
MLIRSLLAALLAALCLPLIVPWWMSTRRTRGMSPTARTAVATATDFLDTQIIQLRPARLDCLSCLDQVAIRWPDTSIITEYPGADRPFLMVAVCGQCGNPVQSEPMAEQAVRSAVTLGSVDCRSVADDVAALTAADDHVRAILSRAHFGPDAVVVLPSGERWYPNQP